MDYPYYVIPDIEALPDAEGEDRKKIIRRIAALVGDPSSLRQILGLDPEEFRSFYPDLAAPEISTSDAIDSFIENFGDKNAVRSREVKNIEELVPLPPADYNLDEIESDPLIIDNREGASDPTDATASMLDSFLNNGETLNNSQSVPESQEKPERPQLSESLARAMIKNGNYAKALEIITDLSLNNPKKSIYFADQIRFLKKLILNQSKQNKV